MVEGPTQETESQSSQPRSHSRTDQPEGIFLLAGNQRVWRTLLSISDEAELCPQTYPAVSLVTLGHVGGHRIGRPLECAVLSLPCRRGNYLGAA